MHLSIFLGPFSRDQRDDRPLIDWSLAAAEEAVSDGFSMITFGEQHFNNYEPYCNPLLMAARLAPILGDAWFATTVLPLPYHNPIRLAEDIAVVDQLLDGKLIAGMSAGRIGFSPDFENFGLDPKAQREIFAEKMAALEQVFAQRLGDPPIKFEGPWVKGGVHGRLMPVPYRSPRPLIAIGTNTDAVVRKAGADGNVLFLGPATLDEISASLVQYREGAAEAGHDEAFVAERLDMSMAHHQFVMGETDDEAWDLLERIQRFHPLMDRREDKRTMRQLFYASREGKRGNNPTEIQNARVAEAWFLAGSPQTIIDEIAEHGRRGIGMVHTRFGFGPYNPPVWKANYDRFVRDVLPHVDLKPIAKPRPDQIQPDVLAGPQPIGYSTQGPMGLAAANSPEPGRRGMGPPGGAPGGPPGGPPGPGGPPPGMGQPPMAGVPRG